MKKITQKKSNLRILVESIAEGMSNSNFENADVEYDQRHQMSVKEIAEFLESSAEDLLRTEDRGGCCSAFIGRSDWPCLSLSVGWMSGYDDDPGNDYASKKNPKWRINAAIVKYNPYDCAELEYMDQPWDPDTGDVWDTRNTLSYATKEEWMSLAKWYLDQYNSIMKALANGEVRV